MLKYEEQKYMYHQWQALQLREIAGNNAGMNKTNDVYFTCFCALAAMTSPKADSDLLMFWASLRAVPVAPEGEREEKVW